MRRDGSQGWDLIPEQADAIAQQGADAIAAARDTATDVADDAWTQVGDAAHDAGQAIDEAAGTAARRPSMPTKRSALPVTS